MTRTYWSVLAAASVTALAVACGKQSPSPVSPSVTDPSLVAEANADGSTLKATAPVPQSPINDAKPTLLTLVVANATTPHAAGKVGLAYRFQILTPSGDTVHDSGLVAEESGTTSHSAFGAPLEGDLPYRWRARVESMGLVGPWSPLASFVAPVSSGYISGNELYDPLVNGRTVGELHGDVAFVPGKGIQLLSQLGFVSYELPVTLTEGEFSLIVTNLATNTEGGKTKLFGMAQNYDDLVTNDRRMTVEKRGDPPGTVAWRFITHGDQVDTEGAEREIVQFNPSEDYFWQATWRSNFFNVLIREGGPDGPIIYDKGKGFEGRAYDPNPHVLYLGAPVGRSGPDGASVDGVIIRHVWVSNRERPSGAR